MIAPPHVVQTPMRDGVRLVADVYGADDESPRPVLLERTPYGRRNTRSSDQAALGEPAPSPGAQAEVFAAEGFVVVRQDCRGRGDSDGVFEKYVHEGLDGVDTIAWLRQQPWCDGRVFMTGVSYSAHAQTAAAGHGAPVSGMIIDSGGLWHPFEAGIRVGGAFELKQATWAMRHALKSVERRSPQQRAALESVDIGSWFDRMPWTCGDSPLAAAPEYERSLFQLWGEQVFDEAWRTPSLWAEGFIADFPAVPAVLIGSWYDPYVRSTIPLFQNLHERHDSSLLILGPWTHGARATTCSGDVEFGPAAAFDVALGADAVRWRAQWLARTAAGERGDDPPVRYFVMGGGTGRRNSDGRLEHGGAWSTATAWPPAEAAATVLHLGAGGTLCGRAAGAGSIALSADPSEPTRTRGGQVTSGEPVMVGGAFDQGVPATDGETPHRGPLRTAVFRSQPLEEPLTIAGPVRVRIPISSDAPDADIAVKLIDEYPPSQAWPNGFAMNLTDGIMRARYREGFGREAPLPEGETVVLHIEAPDVANRFMAGHRVRLDVSTSNFPRFDVNPGTFGKPWDPPRASTTVLAVGEGEATVTVHVLPSGSLQSQGWW